MINGTMHACDLRRQYSEPVGRQTLSIRLNTSAPAEPKLKRRTSNVWGGIFVVRRCMSRLPITPCTLNRALRKTRRTNYIGALPVIPKLILTVPFAPEAWHFMEDKILSALCTALFDCSFA